jgi:hypothetical protein
VQYANARLSGLVFHRSHCHIDMAYNALEYIFAALLDAPPVEHVVLAAIHAAVSELGRRDRRRGVMALRDMAARLRGASGR